MHQYLVKGFFIFFVLVIGAKAFGQTSTVSNPTSERENNPYSRIGIGTPQNGNSIVLQGMGNISSAYENPYQMNTANPASYAFLKLTTYEAGAHGTINTIATNSFNYQTGTATLSYMNIGIPIGKNAGMCIGMRPQTNVFYDLVDTSVTGIGPTQGLYSGSGSVNFFYIGGAYKYKSLSIGFNAGYMFGQIRNSVVLNNIDTNLANKSYNSDFSRYTKIGGIYWQGGLLYEHPLKKDMTLRVGGTFTMKQNLNAWLYEYWTSTYSLIDTFIQDTSYNAPRQSGKIVMPMSYSIGVQLLSADKWMLGLDYTATQWTQFRNFGLSDSLADAYKISIGGEYTPNASNIRSYLSRVTYRAGFYYGRDMVYLRNTNLSFYGFTLGTSLPVKRSASHIHLALDIGSLGTKSNSLLQETYVRFSVGFSFADKWFVKRKYD